MKKTLTVLFALVMTVVTFAQSPKVLSGKVVDSDGEVLVGAGILVKGTNQGFITDFDGNFTLSGVKYPATLVVSYIGYDDTEVVLTGKESSPYTITIDQSANRLDEVVVVGYGTQKRKSLTGAVGIVDGSTLNQRPVVSAVNALQGADPSVSITTSNGSPNSSSSIHIRGTLSVNSSSALVLIDGVEGDLSMLNPNDIESVSILKDASSCAVYGAKASAGVVLVTTKAGSSTKKATVNYSFRQGWIQPTTDMDFIDTGYEHISLINYFQAHSFHGARVNEYGYTVENGELLKLYERRFDKVENPARPWVEVGSDGLYHYYGNFDWFNFFYNTNRPTQEHNVSVSGGTKEVRYYASGRFYTEEGLLKGGADDDFKSYSVRSKIDANVNSWIKYSNNIMLSSKNYQWLGNSDMESTFQNMWRYGSPAFVPYNPDGTFVAEPVELEIAAVQFMMGKMPAQTLYGGNRNTKKSSTFTMTNRIDAKPVKGLTISGVYDYRRVDHFNTYRTNKYNYSKAPGEVIEMQGTTSSYKEDRDFRIYNDLTGTIQYENTWGGHYFKALAGSQFETGRVADLGIKAVPILTETYDSFGLVDQSATEAGPVATYNLSPSNSEYATLGFFGRLNYDYKGRYILEASARYDGSSRFSPEHRWGFFPSAAAAWRFSEEPFLAGIHDVMSNGKIRLSAGSLGNQQVSNYYYIEKISIDNTADWTFDKNTKIRYASISSPVSSDLTWETVNTYNAGLDFGFFNERLTFSGDAYIRDTKNMLTASVQLPEVYGASSPKENCADLRTRGWEVSLAWKDSFKLFGKKGSYGISGFLGDNRTFITRYYNPTGTLSSHYVGKELGTIWGYRSNGLFPTDEIAQDYTMMVNCQKLQPGYYVAGGGVCVDGAGAKAGDFWLLDLNDDGEINNGANTLEDHGDLDIIGNTTAHLNYSFRLDFNYAGFDISAYFQGIGHKDWFPNGDYGGYAFWGPYSSTSISFIHKDFMKNVWSESNPDAYFPRPRGYSAYISDKYNYWTGLGKTNDYFLQNIGYLRFKNFTIGYTVPEKLSKKIAMNKIRVYFSGENLWYWSPLKKVNKIIDPELASASGTATSNTGVGYLYPRTLSLGVNITF